MKLAKLLRLRHSMGILLTACSVLFLQVGLTAQETGVPNKNVLAPTPPMGWNSWDSYGLRINEQQFRDNVEALATKLKSFGYTYAVIDEGWYMANPEDRPKPELLKYALDENGRFIPVLARFPSALQSGKNTAPSRTRGTSCGGGWWALCDIEYWCTSRYTHR